MGHGFRDSRSTASMILNRRTVKEGECMGVWDLQGEYRVVTGPSRQWLFCSRIQFMTRWLADAHQFIVVRHRDGVKEHLRGPIALFEDPVRHESISVRDATKVDAFEVLVVYNEDAKGSVERHLVRGPTVFIPDVSQWIHSFSWTGAKPGERNNGDEKVAGALKFTKLRVIADQFYYDAKDVRTADDAVLTVKIMLFFELADIEVMLNSTHDPIADFINACLADLMNFGSQRTYDAFVAESRGLSELDTFPVLLQRAAAVGFRIKKVVYRGYEASRVLQDAHDKAVRSRQELHLKQEVQEQEQRQRDTELNRSTRRGAEEREAESARQGHRLQLEVLEATERLRQREQEQQQSLKHSREDKALLVEQTRAEDEVQLTFLAGLASQGVDLTQYLVSRHVKASDRVIRVMPAEGGVGGNVSVMLKQ